jgi:ribosome-associated protein
VDDLPIDARTTIPGRELHLAFARAGGPGGQNVNKVASKVELRWSPASSAALSDEQKQRIVRRLGHRLTKDGELIVTSARSRDQARNRDDARAKLARIVSRALEEVRPRKPTRPSAAARRRRLREKRQRSVRKQGRRPPADDPS